MRYVYFLRLGNGLVKIGQTKDLRQRLQKHRIAYGSIKLIGIRSGGEAEEKRVHSIFEKYRVLAGPNWHGQRYDTDLFRMPENLIKGIEDLYAPTVGRLLTQSRLDASFRDQRSATQRMAGPTRGRIKLEGLPI